VRHYVSFSQITRKNENCKTLEIGGEIEWKALMNIKSYPLLEMVEKRERNKSELFQPAIPI